MKLMNETTPPDKRDYRPAFIRKLLAEAPLLPGESREGLIALFHEFEVSSDSAPVTASEYMMLFEVMRLTLNIQRLERNRRDFILHRKPAAVATLLRRTSKYGYAEGGSEADETEKQQTRAYFTSEEVKKKLAQQFDAAGYGPDAVDVEAREQAFAACAKIDQQIGSARRQLMAFLKELERRNARREAELRNVAMHAIERAKTSAGSGARS
jgi:hypothetical protein